MRAMLMITVLLALAATAWLLWSDDPAPTPGTVERAPRAEAPPPPPLQLTPPAPGPAQALPVSPPPAPEDTAPGTGGEADGQPLLEGRVRLVHADGRHDDDLSGELVLLVWQRTSLTAQTGSARTLAVTAGRFRLAVDPADHVEVMDVVLDGRPAVPLEPGLQLACDAGPLLIEVRRLPALVLHVTDASSGAHLDRVDLRQLPPGMFGMALTGPGREGTLLRAEATSPITLEPTTAMARHDWITLEARSPGHARGELSLDPSTGGEHRLALASAGALDVFLEGARPPPGALVRLRRGRAEGAPDRELVPGEALPLAVEQLQPGRWHVQLDLGDWFDGPTLLAHQEVMVAAGRRTRVVLDVDQALVPRPTRLAGSLALPAFWRREGQTLAVIRVGQRGLNSARQDLPVAAMDAADGAGELLLWDAGPVLSGRYELTLSDPRVSALVEVPPEGLLDAHLAVGPPGSLSVDIVDAESGASLPEASLSWSVAVPLGVASHGEHLARDGTTGLFELVAPQGPVRLSAVAPDHGLATITATVRAGGDRVVLRAPRHYRVFVLLDSGQDLLPVPGGLMQVTFEPLEGDGQRVAFGLRDGREFVQLDSPGRYRFTVDTPPGFLEIPPQVVEVGGAGVTEHVIRLVPR